MAIPYPRVNTPLTMLTAGILQQLARYHRYQVKGLEHVPQHGPALLVVHHSLATYDLLLLARAITEQTHRYVRPLSDRLLFRLPLLRRWAKELGAVQGQPNTASALLHAGELVMVAPGGMREALRPSSQRYQLDWHNRFGFARLALRHNVPIVLAACPRADELYDIYENRLTWALYQRYRIPLPLAKGVGWSLLPQAIALTHVIQPAFLPSSVVEQLPGHLTEQQQVEQLQQHCIKLMQQLLQQRDSR